jgi:hypothetical protein
MQALKRKRKKPRGEKMDIKKRYMHGELAPDRTSTRCTKSSK